MTTPDVSPGSMLPDHNEIIRNRYGKIDTLRAQNIDPFPTKWDPSHSSAQIREKSEDFIASSTSVRIAGRIMTIRSMGKAYFFHLKDQAGRIQVYLRRDIAEEDFAFFKQHIDMGDIVGVEGEPFITKTGELTIMCRHLAFLTKAVRPLPEKWHGLKDTETRYRQRYVDLIANDEVLETFISRSRLVSSMRNYLTGRGYLEVETPMMHTVVGGAAARPFKTHHNALDIPLYLRIAPELYLKRLTVGGLEKTFEINRNFRNEGISTRHNPEFTMLELYTAYWDYRDTMQLTEDTIRHVAGEVFGKSEFSYEEMNFDIGPAFPRVTYLQAIRRYVPGASDIEFSWTDAPDVTKQKMAGLFTPEQNTTHGMLIELFESRVEEHLKTPVFITEFPKAVSPLAKSKPDDPLVAERFELYVCGMEIANGYSELNDPREQYERFRDQVEAKARGDEEATDMDEDYIRALEYGMPPTSGLGVGIDRLTMILTNSPSIRDVILFPLMKPE